MTRTLRVAGLAAAMGMLAATGAVALRHRTDANGYLVSEAIDAKDWQVDPADERDERRPVFISQALYDEAKAQGVDLTGYRATAPIPKAQFNPLELIFENRFGDDEAFPGLFNVVPPVTRMPHKRTYRQDLEAMAYKSKRVKANRARKRAARKARRAQS